MSIALIILIVIVVLIILFIVMIYNQLIKLRNSVREGFSTMDVYLKKRFDLIPNLVETVKGYASHEKETLTRVIEARNAISTTAPSADRIKSENELSGALRQLFALSESYPDLKANANFMDLQNQLKGIEGDIANSRKYYNATVRTYNNKVEMVPSNIIAGLFHFTEEPMYEVDSEEERQNVQVSFDA
jgi:LemA protein